MNIDAFIDRDIAGDCTLLKRLYEFMRANDSDRSFYIDGLDLLEIEPYGGTILYNPRMTPANSLPFASTGRDDVHFGMLETNGLYGDASPIIMTVPMADDDPTQANFVVGETLYDFLCIGCAHGYGRLECLAYSWQHELFELLAGPVDDDPSYQKLQSELGLSKWDEIEHRQQELDRRIKPLLRFR